MSARLLLANLLSAPTIHNKNIILFALFFFLSYFFRMVPRNQNSQPRQAKETGKSMGIGAGHKASTQCYRAPLLAVCKKKRNRNKQLQKHRHFGVAVGLVFFPPLSQGRATIKPSLWACSVVWTKWIPNIWLLIGLK